MLAFNLCVTGGRSVVASANPLAGIGLAEGGLGALGITVSAPVVVGVASALVLAGVAWHYRDEIQGVAGWIAQNVAGAVIEAGGSIYVNSKKVIDSYNSMREKGSISDVSLSSTLNGLPTGVLIAGNPGNFKAPGCFVKIPNGGSFTIPIPSGSYAYSGSSSLRESTTIDSNGYHKGSRFPFGRVLNYDGFNTISFIYYSDNGGYPYPPLLHPGQSISVEFPQNLSPAKDIGNDTFVSVPKDSSVSVDGVVNRTAPQVAQDIPISVQNGQTGVAVPVKDVLNPSGSIPLAPDGSISIPTSGTGTGTATGEGTGTATGEQTGTGEGTGTGIWDWLKDLLNKILNVLKDILTAIGNFISSLLEGLKELLISLFVPSDTFFKDKINSLRDLLVTKFGNNNFLDGLKSANGYRFKNLTVTAFGKTATIVNFDDFYNHKDTFDKYITGFIFFLLALYNYNQIYKLIRKGTTMNSSSNLLTGDINGGDGKK